MTKGGLRMRVGKLGTWLICAGAMAAFGSLAGNYVWTSRWPSTLDAAPTESVKIAAVAYIGSCPILMAKENGYLASEGIAAEVNFQANGKVALAEALQGRADLATAADTPIMFAAMNDQPVSVIAAMTAMEDHAIVGRKDRGIISPSSLKGKRLGVTMGTTTQFFLDAFLNRQQFTPTDITLVDMLPQKLAETLARGDIDAVVLYQPFLTWRRPPSRTRRQCYPAKAYTTLCSPWPERATTSARISQRSRRFSGQPYEVLNSARNRRTLPARFSPRQ